MITIIPIVMEYTTMTVKKTETEIKITTIMSDNKNTEEEKQQTNKEVTLTFPSV